MYVARILYPVKVLGPGERIGIWFAGCPRRCKGCSNPELWEKEERYNVKAEVVFSLIEKISSEHPVDGITITGGDPFYQYEDLRMLIDFLKPEYDDILVYTGYTYEQLNGKDLSGISVLIDGEYIEEKNEGQMLIGSTNQRIIYLNKDCEEKYKEYLQSHHSEIQNFTTNDGVVSVGIHKPGFKF